MKLRETSKEERRGERVNKKRRSEWGGRETERKCKQQETLKKNWHSEHESKSKTKKNVETRDIGYTI